MIIALKTWITSIVAVILFITIIETLLPEGSMKKYVGLICGVVVVLVVISPFAKAFNHEIIMEVPDFKFEDKVNQDDIKEKGSRLEQIQAKKIVKVYANKIEKDAIQRLKSVKGIVVTKVICEVEENMEQTLGDIRRMQIFVNKPGKNYSKDIAPVKIDLGKQNKIKEDIDTSIKEEIFKQLQNAYGIEKQKITIITQE